jgi:predicted ferric reductase
MTTQNSQTRPDQPSGNNSSWMGIILLTGLLVIIGSMVILPVLVPGLVFSVLGEKPKVFWFVSRGMAVVSFIFLWISMVLGLLITGKIARFFPGAFTANYLHQYVSIAGLVTGLIHGVVLIGDKFMDTNLGQILIPFAYENYRPVWVAFGQIAFYLWLITTVTFYIKKRIGYKAWRVTHYLSFITYAGILIHGILSGTDTNTGWVSALYWISGGSVFFLTLYRILALGESKTAAKAMPRQVPMPNAPVREIPTVQTALEK